MPGVLTQDTGRQDVIIRRGAHTEWAVRWTNSVDGGRTFQPVDVNLDPGVVELRSSRGEVWLTRTVYGASDGMVVILLGPDDFTNVAWDSRSGGEWFLTLTHEGREERLAEGYFYLED